MNPDDLVVAAARTHSVWARIVPDVRENRSFHGKPSDRNDSLEITQADVRDMRESVVGKPICWNHKDDLVCGVVGASRENAATKSWDVRLDISDDTHMGKTAMSWVESGAVAGVSLKHVWGSNVPIEVSLCPRGARDGSGIIRDANTGKYTTPLGDGSVIAASALEEAEDKKLGYFILSFDQLDIVAASEMSAPSPTAAAPAAAAAAAPPAVPSFGLAPDAEMPDASADGPVDLTDFPTLKAIQDRLSNSHSIPTKADKEEIMAHATELEEKAADAQALVSERDAELVKLRAEMDKLKEDQAGERAANGVVMEDMVTQFGSNQDAITVSAAMDANPALRTALNNVCTGIVKDDRIRTTISNATAQKLNKMRLNLKAGPAAELGKPVFSHATALHNERGHGLTPGARHTVSAARTSNNMHPHTPSKYKEYSNDDESMVIAASSDFTFADSLKPGQAGWGAPISGLTVDLVVAASAGLYTSTNGKTKKTSRHEAKLEVDASRKNAEPGSFLNFDHKFFTEQSQRAVMASKSAYWSKDEVPEFTRKMWTGDANRMYDNTQTLWRNKGISREDIRNHVGPYYADMEYKPRSLLN